MRGGGDVTNLHQIIFSIFSHGLSSTLTLKCADIFCFDFRSNFLVSVSFLINIGKEMSLPGFRRKPSGSIVLDQKFRSRIKCLGEIYFHLTKSWNHVFIIVKTNASGISGGRLVFGLFYILNM